MYWNKIVWRLEGLVILSGMMKIVIINIFLYVKNCKIIYLFFFWKIFNYVVFCNIYLKYVVLLYLKIILEVICFNYILFIKI